MERFPVSDGKWSHGKLGVKFEREKYYRLTIFCYKPRKTCELANSSKRDFKDTCSSKFIGRPDNQQTGRAED